MIDVEFSNISKVYDPGLLKKKVLAVDNLSLQIRKGEVFGLIGPNGAGKSTTIRLLLGLIRPTRGRICFKGEPLGMTRVQEDIGYLPENPYLYDHLSLKELLTFCGTVSGMATREINSRTEGLLERLDLVAAARRPLRSFSKGMLQRAGICFALMHDPSVVVLDEPMSGLDPVGRKMVFDLVSELKERGKTVFFCSHILSDVERLCDRIGIMVRGRLRDEFRADIFEESDGHLIDLELAASPEAVAPLADMIELVRGDGDRCRVRFPRERFFAVVQVLAGRGVEILTCRSDQTSLEDRFLRVLEEAEQ